MSFLLLPVPVRIALGAADVEWTVSIMHSEPTGELLEPSGGASVKDYKGR